MENKGKNVPKLKSIKKPRRTKKQILSDKNKVLNLFVMNSDGHVEIVQLETEHSKLFINRFGLENIPHKDRFLEFRNAINEI